MASRSSLVTALLLSQVYVAAATTPYKDGMECVNLGTCSCSVLGLEDDTTKNTKVYTSQYKDCCKSPKTATCGTLALNSSSFCAATGAWNPSAYTKAAGADDAAKKKTCCMAVTCKDVQCSATRRRASKNMKAKTGVALTTKCTSDTNCITSCCEADDPEIKCSAFTCPATYTAITAKKDTKCKKNTKCSSECCEKSKICGWGASSKFKCGTGKTQKKMSTSTYDSNCKRTDTMTGTATMAAKDETEYQKNCCEAKAKCSAFTCPTATHEDAADKKTKECFGATCSATECCKMKTTKAMCSALCTGGFDAQGCGATRIDTCTWDKCGKDMVIDTSKFHDTASATDATKKTACCIKGAATNTCSAYFAKAAKAANPDVAGARSQEASVLVWAFAALLSIKLAM